MIEIDKLKKMEKALTEISEDAAADAKNFDGKEFNGRNIAEYLGNLSAATASLAEMLKILVEEIRTNLERYQ